MLIESRFSRRTFARISAPARRGAGRLRQARAEDVLVARENERRERKLADVVVIFGLVAGAASIVGLGITVYYARRSIRPEKRLVYRADVTPFPVVSSTSLEAYNLSVVFQPRGEPEERIKNAYVQYLGFANVGREPIRRQDIAPANPLRVEVAGTRVLDLAIEEVHRTVSVIEVGALPEEPPADDNGTSTTTALITFDFLDYQDGALIRVLSTSRPKRLALAGDIIGMPTGIGRAGDIRAPRVVRTIGWVAAVAFEISALALTTLAFRWAVGEWNSIWVLILPPLALLVPLVISLLIADAISPRLEVRFPRELIPRGLRFRSLPHPDVTLAPGDALEYELLMGIDPPREPREPQPPSA